MAPEQPNGVSVSETALPLDILSGEISKNVRSVSRYLAEQRLPQPSFESDGPSAVLPAGAPQSVQQARQSLIAACLELFHLAVGPSEFLPNMATGVRQSPKSPCSAQIHTY
jgi:6-hydroxytryprostatin B O-methyltransferase